MTPLSKRQQELYDFIQSFQGEHSYDPTYLEMAEYMKVTTSRINGLLGIMEDKGSIRRGIQLLLT